MELRTIESLFEDQMKDLYSAEVQLLKALGKMAKRAESDALRGAFEMHAEETKEHIERLKGVAEELGLKLGGKKCAAMEGIIEEGSEVLEADGLGPVIDAALAAAAQRAEHYEITGYGTARTLARHLGLERAVEALQQTLDEESATDEKLTQLCLNELLPAAGHGMGEMEEEMGGGMMEEGEIEERGAARSAGSRGRSQRRTAGRSAGTGSRGKSASRAKKGKGNGGVAKSRGRGGSRAKSRSGGTASSRRR